MNRSEMHSYSARTPAMSSLTRIMSRFEKYILVCRIVNIDYFSLVETMIDEARLLQVNNSCYTTDRL